MSDFSTEDKPMMGSLEEMERKDEIQQEGLEGMKENMPMPSMNGGKKRRRRTRRKTAKKGGKKRNYKRKTAKKGGKKRRSGKKH